MKKKLLAVTGVALLFIAGFFLVTSANTDPRPESLETVPAAVATYERVNGTGILRCGYYDAPPFFISNPEAPSRPTGLVPQIMTALQPAMGLAVEFVRLQPGFEEQDIEQGRIDAHCFAATHKRESLRLLDMGRPLFALPFYAYGIQGGAVKPGQELNRKDVRVIMPGGLHATRAAALALPTAEKVPFRHTGRAHDIYALLQEGKADVVVTDPASAADYNNGAPTRKLVQLTTTPYVYLPIYIGTIKGDTALRQLIDNALLHTEAQGAIKMWVDKNNLPVGALKLPPAPFQ